MPLLLNEGRVYAVPGPRVLLDPATNELCFWAETLEEKGVMIRVAQPEGGTSLLRTLTRSERTNACARASAIFDIQPAAEIKVPFHRWLSGR
jgi:hypothetical protein